MPVDEAAAARQRIIIASMVGTTIEFYDFYIYATAAVSVFPLLFFPKGDAGAALTPFAAVWLARNHGVGSVGTYLAALGALTFIALLISKETKHTRLDAPDESATVGIEVTSP